MTPGQPPPTLPPADLSTSPSPARGRPPRLELRDVRFGYGAGPVLKDVSLCVEQGEWLGLIGPNGAGKSTLLRVMAGILVPGSGEVRLDGVLLTHLRRREVARRAALMPQSIRADGIFPVYEAVMMGRYPHLSFLRAEGSQDRAAVEAALRQTDTASLAGRLLGELSGGERQRVMLARSLAQTTGLLLLDEPTANLDAAHQIRLLGLLRELADTQGSTIVTAMHDLNLAARYCDRLALIYDGRIAACGRPAEVLQPRLLESVYKVPFLVQVAGDGRPLVHPAAGRDRQETAGGEFWVMRRLERGWRAQRFARSLEEARQKRDELVQRYPGSEFKILQVVE